MLWAIDAIPTNETFEYPLSYVAFAPTDDLSSGGDGLCSDYGCTYFYPPGGKSFTEDTRLGTFYFWVEPYADPGVIPFDLAIVADGEPIQLANEFTVLTPIPEPSTWLLILSGFALLAGRRFREMVAT